MPSPVPAGRPAGRSGRSAMGGARGREEEAREKRVYRKGPQNVLHEWV